MPNQKSQCMSESNGLLIAPITITATKPLLPTHAKGFLWVDVLYRSNRLLGEVTYRWNPRLPNLTGQTVRFWEYLDRTLGGVDYAQYTDLELGELYVRFHAEPELQPYQAIRPYVEQVERGWTHPAGERVLQSWTKQLRLLDVLDPGLTVDRPFTVSVDELLAELVSRGLCLDHRRYGGPVYLDGTRWGMPLRTVVSSDGHVNYLLMLLRDLVPVVASYQQTILVHDEDIVHDYALLDRILCEFGARTSRLALGRVPLGGVVRSSRYGGWSGRALSDLADACLREFDLPTYQLGMRIYFITMLKRTAKESFRPELLRRAMIRARRLLTTGNPSGELMGKCRNRAGWIDPYRLMQSVYS